MPSRSLDRFDLPGLAAIVARHADDVDAKGRLPTEAFAAIRERGLLGAAISREHGGLGLSTFELFEVCRAVGHCGCTGLIFDQHLTATAYASRWSAPAVRGLLKKYVDGEGVLGIGTMPTLTRPGGPMKAIRVGGRVIMKGVRAWYTGVGLMTEALLAAEYEDNGDEVALAIAPMSALKAGPRHEIVVFTGSMTCPVTVDNVDVTEYMLDSPPQRSSLRTVASIVQTPFVAGLCMALVEVSLDLIRRTRGLAQDVLQMVDTLAQPYEALLSDMQAFLSSSSEHWTDDHSIQLRQKFYGRLSLLMLESMAVMLSAGAGSGLKVGATQNRVAREVVHAFARFPLNLQLALSVSHLIAAGVIEQDEPTPDGSSPDFV